MIKPLIGIPGRRKAGGDIVGVPEPLQHQLIDIYYEGYARCVIEAGGVPVHIPVGLDPADLAPHLDGVLLSGGADIEPRHYGQDADGNGEYDPTRDSVEFALVDAALALGLPILGICRGIQVLNVRLGGSLHQHVPEHAFFDRDPALRVHEVELADDCTLRGFYPERIKVNSLHHQMVDDLGHGLCAIGFDDQGRVEALEDPDRCILGVQWHPEMHDGQEPVFDWLVEQAAAFRQRRSNGGMAPRPT